MRLKKRLEMRTKSWTPTGVRTGGPHVRQEEGRGGAGGARRRRDAGRRRRARRGAQDDGVEVVRGVPAEKLHREALGLGYDGRRHHRSKGGAHVREGAVRPAGDRAPRGARAGPDREHAAQGGAGRPKSGRLGPGFDLEQEQVRARREIEAGDRPAPPLDHRFLEDIEELL